MVKIPELAEDGQNWKIYHTKFLEVAATFNCLEVLAGRPYKGDDWDGCNALLCCTFMESVPPSIYFKICCRTAQENFKYLAKRFHDNDPIPHANELQCAGTAAAVEMPENYPMSANAATEWHANANSDEDDLSTTKDLTRGTEDVDDRNVRCIHDPRTSSEDSAKGTSAKCIKMTPVILESTPHETQDRPHSSLPLTPRPPIEGEPGRCKQEVADSVTTAGRTNGMAKMAKQMDADVDRMTLLGGELAEKVCGVDKGDRMEHKSKSRLQQTKLLCKKDNQCSGNANRDLPIANGLPLEGEWSVYASGESRDSKGDTSTSNAVVEHADGSDGQTKLISVKDLESESCESGMVKREHVDTAETAVLMPAAECCQ